MIHVHRSCPSRWCTVTNASPGGRIAFQCGTWIDYQPVLISLEVSHANRCPECVERDDDLAVPTEVA